MKQSQFSDSQFGILPSSVWLTGAEQLYANVLGLPYHPSFLLWIIVPASLGAGVLAAMHLWRSKPVLMALVLLGTALPYCAAMCMMKWVQTNMYLARYLYPPLLLITLASAILSIAPLEPRLARVPLSTVTATAVMLLAALIAYGFPSVPRVRRDLNRLCGSMTTDVLNSGVEVIAGDYWSVWPAVWHANLVLYERKR